MNKVQVPQKQLQQLCFLQLQLTEIEQVLESYIDLLVFYTQYSFIFDEQISEIPPVTQDPIRDGVNWFAYVNNDPVNFVDLWGLSASDNNVLKVSIDDPTAFEAAADKYLMGGKECVAG